MREKRLQIYMEAAIVFAAGLLLILKTEESSANTVKAVKLCLERVIPSLFPFFVVSALISYLRIPQKIGGKLGKYTGKVLGLSGAGAAILAVGLFSGFPVGAASAAALYQAGGCSGKEAEKLLPLSNNPSPAFMLAVVGEGVFHKKSAAILLMSVSLFSVLMLMLWLSDEPGEQAPPAPEAEPERTVFRGFQNVIITSGHNVLQVCAYVVFFGTFTGFMPKQALLRGIVELTGGMYALEEWNLLSAVQAAFLLNFGGLCVAGQTLRYSAEAGLSMKKYLIVKTAQGILAAANVFAVLTLHEWGVLIAAAEVGAVFLKKYGKKAASVLYSQ